MTPIDGWISIWGCWNPLFIWASRNLKTFALGFLLILQIDCKLHTRLITWDECPKKMITSCRFPCIWTFLVKFVFCSYSYQQQWISFYTIRTVQWLNSRRDRDTFLSCIDTFGIKFIPFVQEISRFCVLSFGCWPLDWMTNQCDLPAL